MHFVVVNTSRSLVHCLAAGGSAHLVSQYIHCCPNRLLSFLCCCCQLLDTVLVLDIRSVGYALHSRIRQYTDYHKVTYILNNLFREASQQAMLDAGDCAICRNPMLSGKVLPCRHIFHLSCLRAWFQQCGANNYNCPLCRSPLIFGQTRSSSEPAPLDSHEPVDTRLVWSCARPSSHLLAHKFILRFVFKFILIYQPIELCARQRLFGVHSMSSTPSELDLCVMCESSCASKLGRYYMGRIPELFLSTG